MLAFLLLSVISYISAQSHQGIVEDGTLEGLEGLFLSKLKATGGKMGPFMATKVPTIVTTGVSIRSLQLNEKRMETQMAIYFRQSWFDPRLSYDEKKYKTKMVTLGAHSAKNLWEPSTYFLNFVSGKIHDVTEQNSLLRFNSTGHVMLSMSVTATFDCSLCLRKFPHDEQNCGFQFTSYPHSTTEVIYQWDPDTPVSLMKAVSVSQFSLQPPETWVNTGVYSLGNWSIAGFSLRLQRQGSQFVRDIYFPATLLVFISWFTFVISPDAAPARVTVGVVTILTVVGQHAVSQERGGRYLTASDIWQLVTLVFAFAAFFEFALVHWITRRPRKVLYFLCRKWSPLPHDHLPLSKVRTPPEIHINSTENKDLLGIKDNSRHNSTSSLSERFQILRSAHKDTPENVKKFNYQVAQRIDFCSLWIFPFIYLCFVILYVVLVKYDFRMIGELKCEESMSNSLYDV